MNDTSLENIIKKLPYQIEVTVFKSNGKCHKPEVYDLIIVLYRNEISYRRLECSNNGTLKLTDKLIEFYDGELIDNVKKILDWLHSTETITFKKIYAGERHE
jgi:hypothetical protein